MKISRTRFRSARSGVSATRIIVSAVVLGFVIGLMGVEVIAAMGYRQTITAFEDNSENGRFRNLSFADAEGLVKYSAGIREISSSSAGTEYRYDWFSLFRRDLFVYVIASADTPRKAVQWATVPASDATDDTTNAE